MNTKTRYTRRIALIAVLSLFFALKVQAAGPLEQLRLTVQKALQTLRDPKLLSEDKKNVRVHRVMKIVNPIISYEEIAKRSLGAHWRRQTPSKQRDFVRLFRRFLERVYSTKIPLYDGQTVVFAGEATKGNYARVDGNIVNKKGEKSSIVFKLLRLAGKWKIYDLIVKNVSLTDNYYSQFDRIISNSSYEELIKKIKNKTGSKNRP